MADLHFTQMALFWLSGHQRCACYRPRPPLTLLQMSLLSPSLSLSLSLSLSYSLTHTHTHTHTHTRACGQAPHSPVAGSFCLPSACRLEDPGSEGGLMERRVARQNGWSHEQRSVYKPKAEPSKGGKGKEKLQGFCFFSEHHEGLEEEAGKPAMTKPAGGGTDSTPYMRTILHTRCLCL